MLWQGLQKWLMWATAPGQTPVSTQVAKVSFWPVPGCVTVGNGESRWGKKLPLIEADWHMGANMSLGITVGKTQSWDMLLWSHQVKTLSMPGIENKRPGRTVTDQSIAIFIHLQYHKLGVRDEKCCIKLLLMQTKHFLYCCSFAAKAFNWRNTSWLLLWSLRSRQFEIMNTAM